MRLPRNAGPVPPGAVGRPPHRAACARRAAARPGPGPSQQSRCPPGRGKDGGHGAPEAVHPAQRGGAGPVGWTGPEARGRAGHPPPPRAGARPRSKNRARARHHGAVAQAGFGHRRLLVPEQHRVERAGQGAQTHGYNGCEGRTEARATHPAGEADASVAPTRDHGRSGTPPARGRARGRGQVGAGSPGRGRGRVDAGERSPWPG